MRYTNIYPGKILCKDDKQTGCIYDENGHMIAIVLSKSGKHKDAIAMAKRISELLNKEAK